MRARAASCRRSRHRNGGPCDPRRADAGPAEVGPGHVIGPGVSVGVAVEVPGSVDEAATQAADGASPTWTSISAGVRRRRQPVALEVGDQVLTTPSAPYVVPASIRRVAVASAVRPGSWRSGAASGRPPRRRRRPG